MTTTGDRRDALLEELLLERYGPPPPNPVPAACNDDGRTRQLRRRRLLRAMRPGRVTRPGRLG